MTCEQILEGYAVEDMVMYLPQDCSELVAKIEDLHIGQDAFNQRGEARAIKKPMICQGVLCRAGASS